MVSHSRRTQNDYGLRYFSDLDFRLASTYSFQDDAAKACEFKNIDDAVNGGSKASEMTSRGKRSNKYAIISIVTVHTQSITQNCATADRTRRIHSNNGDSV